LDRQQPDTTSIPTAGRSTLDLSPLRLLALSHRAT
jgi:hypothetical protein